MDATSSPQPHTSLHPDWMSGSPTHAWVQTGHTHMPAPTPHQSISNISHRECQYIAVATCSVTAAVTAASDGQPLDHSPLQLKPPASLSKDCHVQPVPASDVAAGLSQSNDQALVEQQSHGAGHHHISPDPQPVHRCLGRDPAAHDSVDARHAPSADGSKQGSALAETCRAIDRLHTQRLSSALQHISSPEVGLPGTSVDANASLLWLAAGQPLEELLTTLTSKGPCQVRYFTPEIVKNYIAC